MKSITTLFFVLLSLVSISQVEVETVHQGDTITVEVNNPLSLTLEVERYHCYFFTDLEGGSQWDLDFNGNGLYDSSDLLTLLSSYGGQLGTSVLLEFLAGFSEPFSDPIDAPALELFTLQYWASSGVVGNVAPDLEPYLFEDTVLVLPSPLDDWIGQYTATDEVYSHPNGCEDGSGFPNCMSTWKFFLFALPPEGQGEFPQAMTFYWIRL